MGASGFSGPGNQKQTPSLWEGITRQHWLVFLGCWLGGIFDGMDSTLYTVVQFDAIAEVAHTMERSVISGIGSNIMAIFLLGWVAGGIVFGMIGDKFGRVSAMIGSILLYALFTGAAGLSQTPEQLGLCRFLTGFGIGGELVTIATMLSEVWPERSRAIAVGSLITSYQVGFFLAGLVPNLIFQFADGWDISGWRLVFFVGALPALLAIVLRLQMKESQKWQLAQDNASLGVSAHQHLPLVAIFKKEHARNLTIGALTFGGLLIGYWASLVWIPTWIQDLIGPTAINGTEKTIATMFHGISAVLGCISSGFLADAIGRRKTIIFGYFGCFASSWLLFTTNQTFSEAIYWQDALLGYFIGLSQAIMYVYLPELFPTRIRATAVGFCLNAGRTVTAVAVFFVGTMVTLFGGYDKALLVFSGSYLIAVVAGFFGHETKGQPLPD
ncbi:MAG: MFS transporter [Vampirovibrionales bacterium]|nr:MFS transporter [Vampirovibrionales bacterium]